MKVKFLKPNFPPLRSYFFDLLKIYRNGQFSNNGEYVQRFERALQKFFQLHTKPVCVNNATIGLISAIKALELPEDGAVLVPSYTFPATIQAIQLCGLNAVYCDIDRETLLMKLPEEKVHRVVALMPVCVYGAAFELRVIAEMREAYPDAKIICDAAGALGSQIPQVFDATVYSFHATKVLPVGEGGCMIFKNAEDEQRARRFIDFGMDAERESVHDGLNGKLNEFSAAIGLAALKRLYLSMDKRWQIARFYTDTLHWYLEVEYQYAVGHTYQLFPVICETGNQRARLQRFLTINGVETKRYYRPCHRQDFSSGFSFEDLKITDDIYDRTLCLPMYEKLTGRELLYVCNLLTEFFDEEYNLGD